MNLDHFYAQSSIITSSTGIATARKSSRSGLRIRQAARQRCGKLIEQQDPESPSTLPDVQSRRNAPYQRSENHLATYKNIEDPSPPRHTSIKGARQGKVDGIITRSGIERARREKRDRDRRREREMRRKSESPRRASVKPAPAATIRSSCSRATMAQSTGRDVRRRTRTCRRSRSPAHNGPHLAHGEAARSHAGGTRARRSTTGRATSAGPRSNATAVAST